MTEELKPTTFGRAARKRYERLFSGEVLGRAYSELYRDVIDRRSSAAESRIVAV